MNTEEREQLIRICNNQCKQTSTFGISNPERRIVPVNFLGQRTSEQEFLRIDIVVFGKRPPDRDVVGARNNISVRRRIENADGGGLGHELDEGVN